MVRCTQLLIFISSLYYSSKPFLLIIHLLFFIFMLLLRVDDPFSSTAIFFLTCDLIVAANCPPPLVPPPPPRCPIATGVAPSFHLPLIMPTLNELLLLGSRPKQLLLCLFAHRKRELSPFKSHDIIHLTLFLSTLLPPNFLLFLSSNVVYSVLINFLITIYQIFSPLYTVYSNIHSNIICIAITGNKILCLMSYVLIRIH